MDLLNHVRYVEAGEVVFHGGTYSANLLAVVAGCTLITYLGVNGSIYAEANN